MLRGAFSRLRSITSGRRVQNPPKRQRFSRRRGRRFAEQLEPRCYLSGDPIVQVNTNFGNFQLELFPADAPQTVANFLSYVDSGKYNNLVVSRNVPGFVIQAGAETSPTDTYTSDSQFTPVTPGPNIPLEYKLANTTGTISMARQSGKPGSAANEWFINLADNTSILEAPPAGTSVDGYGYAAFGQVLGNGMQTVNAISAALPDTDPTQSNPNGNKPLTSNSKLALITSMTLLDGVYGTVYSDTNANGKQDSGETGVQGRTVFVNVDGSGQPDGNNPSATTDANGNYYIAAVPAGSYQVEEVLPSGIASSTPVQTIAFSTSSQAANVNLGETIPSISGTVYADLNGSGKFDTGDPGLAGQTVFLNKDNTGKPDNNPKTTTDANGHFSFTGLAAGPYSVMVALPTNVTSSNGTQSVTVAAGQTATANFGELPSITGTVFNDLKVSGKFDSGDPGLAGVTVFLNNDNTGKPDNNPKTTTDANGHFYFMGLAAGSYTVEEVVSANHGVTVTTPAATATVGSTLPANVSIGNVLTSPLVPLVVSTNPPAAAANANTAYINALYQYVLGRVPDSGGLTFWQGQLPSGSTPTAATLKSVAEGFWTSPEHRQQQVKQYYQEFLGRQASDTDLSTWVNNFEQHATVNDQSAVIDFLTTAEYQDLHSGNTALVDAFYNDINLRAADTAGESYWVGQLTKGTSGGGMSVAQVAKDFTYGPEANTRLIDAFYSVFLHRAPSSSDLSGLVNGLVAGTLNADQEAINVLSSTEFFDDVTANQAPQFTSADAASFTQGTAGTFKVTTSGVPIGAISVDSGSTLPGGVTLADNHDGTATLSYDGTMAKGNYTFQLTANNGVGTAPKQSFTLAIQ